MSVLQSVFPQVGAGNCVQCSTSKYSYWDDRLLCCIIIKCPFQLFNKRSPDLSVFSVLFLKVNLILNSDNTFRATDSLEIMFG